jgi:hypothetical protein
MWEAWIGELYKGTSDVFDETSEVLKSPAFFATSEEEALYYASFLPNKGDSNRRVMTFQPSRPLRLLAFERGMDSQLILVSLGLPTQMNPKSLASAVMALGYDGIALDGGDSGWHIILGDASLMRHIRTQQINTPGFDPEQVGDYHISY